jgi:hypothetical protein
MSGYTTKCISCDRKKIDRLGFTTLLRRNYYLIAILVAACPDSDCGYEHPFHIHVSGVAKKSA